MHEAADINLCCLSCCRFPPSRQISSPLPPSSRGFRHSYHPTTSTTSSSDSLSSSSPYHPQDYHSQASFPPRRHRGGYNPVPTHEATSSYPSSPLTYTGGYHGYDPIPSRDPQSPNYENVSPGYNRIPTHDPLSPDIHSPAYDPVSPSYDPHSPGYDPHSPYDSQSPSYGSRSPNYDPHSPVYGPRSPGYPQQSPSYPSTPPSSSSHEQGATAVFPSRKHAL